MQFHRFQILIGTVEEVENLIKQEYDVNQTCIESNSTPLYYAIQRYCESTVSDEKKTSLAIVQLLINKGAEINNVKKEEGDEESVQSPLVYALHNGDIEVIHILLKQESILINMRERNSLPISTPAETQKAIQELSTVLEDVLYFSFRHENEQVVKCILRAKSDSEINRSILRIFTLCLNKRDQKTIEYLFKLYPKSIETTDTNGRTLLCLSIINDFNSVALFLLDLGASVDSTDKFGWTPLTYAVKQGSKIELIEHMIRKCADVNRRFSFVERTVLHLASDLQIMQLLIKFGGDINAKDKDGSTPLHRACRQANEEVVSYLLQAGANLNDKCNRGLTPLHFACTHFSNNSIKMIKLLINHGIDVNARDFSNRTPLHYISTDNDGALKYLVKKGADINAVDDLGNTILHCIFREFCYDEDVYQFLELNANVNIMNNEGETPLELALSRIDPEVLREEDIVKTLVVHLMAKMKTENADISEKNMTLLKLSPFFEEYDLEIENLKNKICSDSYVTFFDFLTKDSHRLAIFCRRKNIKEVLESLNYESDLSAVKKYLFRRIKDALHMSYLLDGVTVICTKYLEWKMPLMALEQIFEYLDIEDIEYYFIKHSPISLSN